MADQKTTSEQTEAQAGAINLSPRDAATLMQGAVNNMRQQWLQAAVTVANVFKGGRNVSQGTIDDLRRLRENYEELERARLVLQSMSPAGTQRTGATDGQGPR